MATHTSEPEILRCYKGVVGLIMVGGMHKLICLACARRHRPSFKQSRYFVEHARNFHGLDVAGLSSDMGSANFRNLRVSEWLGESQAYARKKGGAHEKSRDGHRGRSRSRSPRDKAEKIERKESLRSETVSRVSAVRYRQSSDGESEVMRDHEKTRVSEGTTADVDETSRSAAGSEQLPGTPKMQTGTPEAKGSDDAPVLELVQPDAQFHGDLKDGTNAFILDLPGALTLSPGYYDNLAVAMSGAGLTVARQGKARRQKNDDGDGAAVSAVSSSTTLLGGEKATAVTDRRGAERWDSGVTQEEMMVMAEERWSLRELQTLWTSVISLVPEAKMDGMIHLDNLWARARVKLSLVHPHVLLFVCAAVVDCIGAYCRD